MKDTELRTLGPALILLLLTVLALALSGCVEPLGVRLHIYGAEPVRPDPLWLTWYDEAGSCLLQNGWIAERPDGGRVRWFVADSVRYKDGDANGVFTEPHDITLARGEGENGYTVRHEALHEILYNEGRDSGHRHPGFGSCTGT